MSREELELLTGTGTAEGAWRLLDAHPNLALVVVTEGAGGSSAMGRGGRRALAEAFRARAVDTTGAGDASGAALLRCRCGEP